jgi:hypothetical protein
LQDPAHNNVVRILQQGDLKFFSGFITLLEFECNIFSLWKSGELTLDEKAKKLIEPLTQYQKIRTLTELLLTQFPLEILSVSTIEQIAINQWMLEVENTLTMAYNLSPNIPLKTLDIIQLTSALKMKLYHNRPITYFLTDDQRILEYTDEIRRSIGIIPTSSEGLINTLKIPKK